MGGLKLDTSRPAFVTVMAGGSLGSSPAGDDRSWTVRAQPRLRNLLRRRIVRATGTGILAVVSAGPAGRSRAFSAAVARALPALATAALTPTPAALAAAATLATSAAFSTFAHRFAPSVTDRRFTLERYSSAPAPS
jgi:hypothetical protein